MCKIDKTVIVLLALLGCSYTNITIFLIPIPIPYTYIRKPDSYTCAASLFHYFLPIPCIQPFLYTYSHLSQVCSIFCAFRWRNTLILVLLFCKISEIFLRM